MQSDLSIQGNLLHVLSRFYSLAKPSASTASAHHLRMKYYAYGSLHVRDRSIPSELWICVSCSRCCTDDLLVPRCSRTLFEPPNVKKRNLQEFKQETLPVVIKLHRCCFCVSVSVSLAFSSLSSFLACHISYLRYTLSALSCVHVLRATDSFRRVLCKII